MTTLERERARRERAESIELGVRESRRELGQNEHGHPPDLLETDNTRKETTPQ